MRKLWTPTLLAAVAAAASPAYAQEPNFGRAIAVTDSELFIGQPVNWYGPGIVYTYRLGASGEWVERTQVMASDSSRMDDFGRAIAVDGNTMIIGAPRKRDGSGVAYVFERASADADWRQTGTHEYIGPVNSSDHNLYVAGDRVYESNYGSGLRVLDISDRTNPREIGFFDSAPYNDDGPGHSATQSGAWSNSPFFESGVVIFTSVREGLFIVRVIDPVPVS